MTVADVLGIRQEAGRPVLHTLVEAIGQGHLLVLLDNCEHVIGACAKLADALLRGCPDITLLATSREPLGIDGERVHRVPSMGTPADGDDVDAIVITEAVRLFIDRAAQHGVSLTWDEPTARVGGRICRRLDGIPLAIELAAARLRVMPAAELDARLDQRFSLLTGGSRTALPRQQTLRALVDWSWDLLNAGERQVLARLSVFAGGFDLAAAEAVTCGRDLPPEEVVGHLGALVDKSLVQFDDTGAGPARHRLLETVRQYAARQLQALGPAAAEATQIAHRDHYLTLAEAAAPQLVAHDQAQWLDRLDLELGNLRVAIAFSLTQANPAPGLRLAASLRRFWTWPVASRTPISPAACSPTGRTPGTWRATMSAAAGDAAESLRLCRQAGDQLQAGILLGNLGNTELSTGDLNSARRHLLESLDIARALNDQFGVTYQTFNLGLAEYLSGLLSEAEGHFAEALDLSRRTGMKVPVAYSLIGLAMTGRGEADMGRSARLHGAADRALVALGHTVDPLEGRLRDLDFERLRSAMGAEAFEAEFAAGQALTSEQVIDLALADRT